MKEMPSTETVSRDWMTAYQHIRFEQEAYRHQNDLAYLEKRKHYHYLS